MKKVILALAVIFLTTVYVNGQSYSLSWDGIPISDTITLGPEVLGGNEIVFEVILHNNTSSDANIKVARNEILIMEGSVNYFCWGVCYTPSIDTSGMFLTIPAGGQSAEEDFSGHYEINGTTGVSMIEYTFYDMDSKTQMVKIVLKPDPNTVTIGEYAPINVKFSDVYPNPATNFVSIDFDIPLEVNEASITIVNLFGSVVKEQKIDTRGNNMKLDIVDLKEGVYFYSLNINGEIYCTKKLIIR